MNQLPSSRIDWVDAAKGIGIFLVIFAHINTGIIGNWIYSFHIPLFFILSGFVFKANDSFVIFIKKKVRTILIPYICLGTVMALFQIARNILEGRFSVHSSLVIFAELIIQKRYWALWYIACLFGLNILFYFLSRYIKNNKLQFLLVCLLTVIGITYGKLSFPFLPWNIDAVFPTSLFFFAGHILQSNYNKISGYFKGVPSVILIICLLAVNIFTYIANIKICNLPLEIYGSQYGTPPLTYLSAFCGSGAVILISHKLQKIKFITYIGRYSLLYYAWHQQIFIPLIRAFFELVGIKQTQLAFGYQFALDLFKTVVIIIAITFINQLILKSRFRFMIGIKTKKDENLNGKAFPK